MNNWMELVLLISIILSIVGIVFTGILTRKNSRLSQQVFSKCNDDMINKSLGKLDITGYNLLDRLLHDSNLDNLYKIIPPKKSRQGAHVLKNTIYLDKEYYEKLNLETFRDVIHEYRHARDRKLLLLMRYAFYCELFGLILVITFALLKTNIYTFVLAVIFTFICLLINTLCIIKSENRAVLYPTVETAIILRELKVEDDEIKKISDYICKQSIFIKKWYIISNLQLISLYLFISLIIIFISYIRIVS